MISIFDAKMVRFSLFNIFHLFLSQKLGKYEFIFLFSEALNLRLSNAFM